MPIQITTNNVPRDLLSLADLPPDAAKDFDYIDGEDCYSPRLFRYRGEWYDANEFLSTTREGGFSSSLPIGHPLRAWDGYQSDSFFSGVAIRFPSGDDWGSDHWEPDYSRVIAATYISTGE